jgi:fructuronate reductase
MADPELAGFIERLMFEEIAPLTPLPAGFDVDAYVRALLRRFANRSLRHRTLQIAMDGSQKIPVRWLPMLREGRRRGLPCRHLVTALAAWLCFLAGRDEAGRELPLDDPLAPRLRALAASYAQEPAALVRAALEIDEVFGRDLRQDAVLVDQLTAVLARVAHAGVRAALAD